MVSERAKKDIIALSVSIAVNCILTITSSIIPEGSILITGLLVDPIFGGVFKSAVA